MTNGTRARPGTGTITRGPDVLAGKPVVAGTRIPVDLVVKHLPRDFERAHLYAAFPRLTEADVKACFRYVLGALYREQRGARSRRTEGHAAE